MVFGLGLGAGLKALNAARLGIQTAGQNVANVNTPGFTRQRVLQSASMPVRSGHLQIGTGVQISDISRILDAGLEHRMRLQLGMFSTAATDHQRFVELEGIFGEPDGGLSQMFSELFGSVSELQTDPADRALRGGLIQRGGSLADGFNLISSRVSDLQNSSFEEVRGLVRQVNEHAAAIAQLNTQIMSLELGNSSANDLRDTREQHIKEISALMDTQVLERNTGSIDLLAGGHLLVSGSRSVDLSVGKSGSGLTQVVSGSSNSVLNLRSGRIFGVLRQEAGQIPVLQEQLDLAARNLILEFNRLHTTGVPLGGPLNSLTSHYGAIDGDGDGIRGDELLSQASLPFGVQRGDLYVSVTDRTSGDMERTRIAIEPGSMSLFDLANQIEAIEHLSASVDPSGHLRITAENGFGFDFGPSLDPLPDTFGSFGGAAPSLGTSSNGPFDLSGSAFPQSFDVTTGTATSPVTTNVTLDMADFANPAAATVDELVSAINADLGTAATAENIGGRLVIRSDSSGSTSQLQLTDVSGTPTAALGFSASPAQGQDVATEVRVSGAHTGSANGQLIFTPNGDGEIGVTAGLTVGVHDAAGNLIATVDVGRDYTPGSDIELPDGIRVSFGPGSVSSTAGHVFALDTLADSDTSDVLVALGMNSFFHGTSAADIEINPSLSANPQLLAAGLTSASGDAGNLARITALRETSLGSLNSSTIEEFYGSIVGDLAFETSSAELTLMNEDALMAHLERQRESVSGVNVDEEMVNLVRFQQAYEAAARLIDTVNELTMTLINMAR